MTFFSMASPLQLGINCYHYKKKLDKSKYEDLSNFKLILV